MSTATHTPTPWYVDLNRSIYAAYGGGHVALLAGSDFNVATEEANAAHIVLCVNAHDDLRAALRDAEQQIIYLHEKFTETGTGNAILARIRAALAKAEGGAA